MARIIYITGGERSGKSRYAQELALQLSESPVYVATARKWDDDFVQRIEQHQKDRDERWVTIEKEKNLSSLDLREKVVVLDCITLWLNNLFTDNGFDVEGTLEAAKKDWDHLIEKEFVLIVVSNELGMSLHSTFESGRKFTELQGWMNQYVAKDASEAWFMVSGIPLRLK
jgi:adenosylcobinamide kinase / adenosylcobinamide-phosphate guanylyltransferase